MASGAHLAANSRSAFLQRIHDSVHCDPGIDVEEAARAVFAALAARLPAAELEDAKAATPSRCTVFGELISPWAVRTIS